MTILCVPVFAFQIYQPNIHKIGQNYSLLIFPQLTLQKCAFYELILGAKASLSAFVHNTNGNASAELFLRSMQSFFCPRTEK